MKSARIHYDLTSNIRYIKGNDNQVVDALARTAVNFLIDIGINYHNPVALQKTQVELNRPTPWKQTSILSLMKNSKTWRREETKSFSAASPWCLWRKQWWNCFNKMQLVKVWDFYILLMFYTIEELISCNLRTVW